MFQNHLNFFLTFSIFSGLQHTNLSLLDSLGRLDVVQQVVWGRSADEGQAVPQADQGRRLRLRWGGRGERGVQNKWMS